MPLFVPFCFKGFDFRLVVLSAVATCAPIVRLERRRKSTGVGKNGIGLCQLPVDVGGALRVRSGWDCREKREGEEGQKEEMRGGKGEN